MRLYGSACWLSLITRSCSGKTFVYPAMAFLTAIDITFVIHQLEDVVPSRVMLWLMMTGAVSIFRISAEPWLADRLQRQAERCGVRSWKDMQEALKACMWIPLLDEERGKQTYEWLRTGSIYPNRAG